MIDIRIGIKTFWLCRYNTEVIKMPREEIMKNAIDEFRDIQTYMLSAKEENAKKTYAILKEKYASLKALLQSLGVNTVDIDRIKE